MKELSIYLKPVDKDLFEIDENGSTWKDRITIYNDSLPDLGNAKVAIFGVNESRGNFKDNDPKNINVIRTYLYKLEWYDYFPEIVDLGDVLPGNKIEDTYFALESLIETLVKQDIIPLIIGGTHDLTFSQYKGYENLEQLINLVNIDFKIDLGEISEGITTDNFLTSIITHQPNFLFNFSNIGHQAYFNSQDKLAMTEKMFFETLRLGELKTNIRFSEPLIRNADILSIDLRSIRNPYIRHRDLPMPNGIDANEICQMAWYAGMSDKLTSLGIYEYDEIADIGKEGAMLVAQIIWYFIEGVSQRKEDFPKSSVRNYLKYTIYLNEDEHELIFYKSPKSDRWWVEVPYPDGKDAKYFRHLVVPCTYEDYQKASSGEMPDIWWQTFQKLI
jgi:arginase family enzyme